jgi:glycerol uptake facilitator-like aquaporin
VHVKTGDTFLQRFLHRTRDARLSLGARTLSLSVVLKSELAVTDDSALSLRSPHSDEVDSPIVAVVDGFIATSLLVVVVWVARDRRIMGDYVNGRAARALGRLAVGVMGVASITFFDIGGLSF